MSFAAGDSESNRLADGCLSVFLRGDQAVNAILTTLIVG